MRKYLKYLIGCGISICLALIPVVVLAVPSAVTNLIGNPTNTTISLSWTKGSGNQTLVRYKTTGYPANTGDGTQAYLGTNNYVKLTGLTAGARYYFSAWSYDGADYSATSDDLLVSTLASYGLSAGDSMTAPAVSGRFNQTVDATGLANLNPFYLMGNSFWTGWGVDADRGWETFVLAVITALSLAAYVKWKELSISCTLAFLLLGATTMMELTPGWMMLIPVTVGMGVWALENALQ